MLKQKQVVTLRLKKLQTKKIKVTPFRFINNKLTTILLVVVILLLVILGVWFESRRYIVKNNIDFKPLNSVGFLRPLDGAKLISEVAANSRPVAVVLDNHFDARPQHGLDEASLVYETIAEGSITRLLAIFTVDSLPKKLGPIRSLRPYFLDWAKEVDAVAVHVGGSPQALTEALNYENVNEFYDGIYFYRDKLRTAPHNVFTSADFLRQVIVESGYATSGSLSAWKFNNTSAASSTAITSFSINFSLEAYAVSWQYEAEFNRYRRGVAERNAEVYASNVIIQVVSAEVLDSELRRKLYLIGNGKAWVFSNGKMIIGSWKKENNNTRTRFYDFKGEEINFEPGGTTWIEVVDDESRLSF